MKNLLYIYLTFILIGYTTFTACGPKRKMQTSKTQVKETEEKEVVERNITKNEKPVVAKKSTPPAVKSKPANKPSNKPLLEKNSPTPPDVVATIFKTSYPLAKDVLWIKVMPYSYSESKTKREYKADFLLDENVNSVIYSESGELIETRTQIKPDQLPPNIYKAINEKYPSATILYAANVHNTKVANYSYSATITTPSDPKAREVILMEDGAFVK